MRKRSGRGCSCAGAAPAGDMKAIMLDEGLISAEEYDQKKQDILGSL